MNISQIKVGKTYLLGNFEVVKIIRSATSKDYRKYLSTETIPKGTIGFVVAAVEDDYWYVLHDIAPFHAIEFHEEQEE